MQQHDNESTRVVLSAFMLAWRRSIEDYQRRKINSEHCLQASLYRHLMNSLPECYTVYAEARITLSPNTVDVQEKKYAVIDLLVCQEDSVIAAVEIKYVPRKWPTKENVRKDLTSLAYISNRRNVDDRCSIDIQRFQSEDAEKLELKVTRYRKLIFAAFCLENSESLNPESFWANHCPNSGYWEGRNSEPPNLCVALAYTERNGNATPKFFGPGFDRMTEGVEGVRSFV